MEISESVIRLGLRPRRTSISIILHKILRLIHQLLIIEKIILGTFLYYLLLLHLQTKMMTMI